MADLLNFDARTVEPSKALDPIPAGWYRVAITDSGVKPTKDGNGRYLELAHSVLDDGPHKGRKLFARLNIQNQNAQTVQIAQQQLSAICHAVNVMQLSNSAQLHDKPLMIRVVVKQSPGYEPQNEIKGWKAIEGAAPAAGAPAAASQGAPASAAAPAWARKAS